MRNEIIKFKYLPRSVLKFMEELLNKNDALEKQNQSLQIKLENLKGNE